MDDVSKSVTKWHISLIAGHIEALNLDCVVLLSACVRMSVRSSCPRNAIRVTLQVCNYMNIVLVEISSDVRRRFACFYNSPTWEPGNTAQRALAGTTCGRELLELFADCKRRLTGDRVQWSVDQWLQATAAAADRYSPLSPTAGFHSLAHCFAITSRWYKGQSEMSSTVPLFHSHWWTTGH